MRNVDRMILIVLVLGVWALVLKPADPTAHEDDRHSCSGTGYGELDGREVYVYQLDISCRHR
jgi:hypothetical protein